MSPQQPNTADPRVDLARNRTGMARYRTQLALDRTALAWIRTTTALATFGFGMIGFFRTLEEKTPTARSALLHHGAVKFGVALVVMGIAAMVFSGASQWFSLRRLRRGDDLVLAQWPLSITLAALLVILGLGGLGTHSRTELLLFSACRFSLAPAAWAITNGKLSVTKLS